MAMKHHPYAAVFPMMSETEFGALCDDIQKNGLKDEIVTFYDAILDGRNRYAACRKVNERPRFKEFKGNAEEAIAFVLSKNLHRRHLNESQRAMVGAELVKLGKDNLLPIGKTERVEWAATTMNVGVRSLARAEKVLDSGNKKLAAKVLSGDVAVSRAEKILHPVKSKSTYEKVIELLDKLTDDEWIKVSQHIAEKFGA